MNTSGEAKILRIYISNTDKFKHAPLYEMIVFAAKRYGLAGATVIKGIMGFGSSNSVHYIKFWEFTEKIPVVVEIIDEAEKIDSFIKTIAPWFELISYGCLISTEKANIVLYKTGKRKKISII